MKEAIKFMHNFFKHEMDAIVSMYNERDDNIFEEKLSILMKYYSVAMRSGIYREPNRNEKWFKDVESGLQSVSPRTLFQIKQYVDSEFGDIYRCYVNNYIHLTSEKRYYANFYVANIGKKLQIVSEYRICLECDSLGIIKGKMCRECDGGGWHHIQGWSYFSRAELEKYGKPTEIRKLQAPDNAKHLEEYNRE